MNIYRYELSDEVFEDIHSDKDISDYPYSVYVMTYDDSDKTRIYIRGDKHAKLNIYDSFYEAAALIEKMTKRNLYTLSHAKHIDPWDYWTDNYITIRYDISMMPMHQLKKVMNDDLWHKHAGIILKDHYYQKTRLFHASRDFEERKAKRFSWNRFEVPF